MAGAVAVVSCVNPACKREGGLFQVLDDMALPVMCGGCHQVMFCNHAVTEPSVRFEGTYGSPVRVESNRCLGCRAEVGAVRTPVRLDDVPLGALT